MPFLRRSLMTVLALLAAAQLAAGQDWQPAESRLMTRWSQQVTPDAVHPEYPRPQLRRPEWLNLNGLWQYAITPEAVTTPQQVQYEGTLLVPFPVESALSGVKRTVQPDQVLWLSRTFRSEDIPAHRAERRVLLHFEAVDWDSTVWVNGHEVGRHQGGYDPFTFDITASLRAGQPNELIVRVADTTDTSYQPRGKQVLKPEGIWYTAVTGIWQTVWLESVPEASIERLTSTCDIESGTVRFRAHLRAADQAQLRIEVLDGERTVAEARGSARQPLEVRIEQPRLWSPTDPHLYDVRATLIDGQTNEVLDAVDSYVGLREIRLGRDEHGFQRLMLNGKPLFQFGPLDQGWWPEGLYTAPSDEALRYDLEVTQRLGFNMIRKHVKVESRRWYHHCDRMGLLVWQDMPNGDRHIGPRDPDIQRSAESRDAYFREWDAIITTLEVHPCIVVWVPFNEGWGQFETDEVLKWTRQRDPTRLVDGPSGWTDRGTGDLHDVHIYPGPGMPPPEASRAAVLGEFGGLGLPVRGHLWRDRDNWGYRTYTSQEQLAASYEGLIRQLKPLIGRGLAAAVYTQTTDVEGEVNGLMTYDRQVLKFDEQKLAALHRELYQPQAPTHIHEVVPTSERTAQTWRYTIEAPAEGWYQSDFSAADWQEGPGGFGEPTTPGAVVRTPWKAEHIWMRRTFTLDQVAQPRLHLRLHHDEDAEVYLNGTLAAVVSGYVTQYVELELSPEIVAGLRVGENVLAVHCRQTGGGQYIDVGLVELRPLPPGSPSE